MLLSEAIAKGLDQKGGSRLLGRGCLLSCNCFLGGGCLGRGQRLSTTHPSKEVGFRNEVLIMKMGKQNGFVKLAQQTKLIAFKSMLKSTASTIKAIGCAAAFSGTVLTGSATGTAFTGVVLTGMALWSSPACAGFSNEDVGYKVGDPFMLAFHDLNVSLEATQAFDEGVKLSLMMLPSRYADALALLNEAKNLNHPYAPLAILFTNALANRQNYEYEKYSDQINELLEGEDPLGSTLAVFTTIEATDYLKHHDAQPLLDALNKALAKHYIPAWYVKGLTLIKIGYSQVGFDEIKQAADSGYAVAQYHLAFLILSGHLSMDKMYAFNLLQSAVKAGHLGAYRELGYCFEHGIGTRIDKAQAIELYRKGFSYGDISAAASYGLLLLKNPEPNYIESFNALSFAYNNGVNEVANALGILYIKGLGVMMDQAHGFKLIKFAADHNDMLAISNVISCYKNGTGTPKDLNQAHLYEQRLKKLLAQEAQQAASTQGGKNAQDQQQSDQANTRTDHVR